MSWGYVPKKLKNARHQQRMRKKYKNFSCLTCKNRKPSCKERYNRSPWYGLTIVEDCRYWKASDEARNGVKNTLATDMTEKKPSRKGIFSKIFK